MTAIERIRRVCALVIGHVTHVFVLLLPTWVLAGFRGIGWATACFACGITVAAVLESHFVPRESQVRNAKIQDKLAMRVALGVGLCLLALFWSAQIEHLTNGRSSLAVHAMGGSLLVIGIGLRIEAIRALRGRFVSDIRSDGLIVRDGIYGWMRHPSEIGLLLIATGGPLLVGAPATATVGAILLVPISLWRMRRENVALATP